MYTFNNNNINKKKDNVQRASRVVMAKYSGTFYITIPVVKSLYVITQKALYDPSSWVSR